MWTRTATNGILPRHTCSARCRGTASIRDLAVAVGAVPVSINQQVVSNTVCPRHAEIAHDARWPVDMWTTQGRCPHTHRPNNNRNQLQFDKFEKQPTGPEGSKPTWRQGRPTNPLHQLYAGTENHSQQLCCRLFPFNTAPRSRSCVQSPRSWTSHNSARARGLSPSRMIVTDTAEHPHV